MADSQKSIEILERKGVRVTSIRILVMEALMCSSRPMSLSDLETELDTVDKSSIFRTLEVFEKHHIVHSIDDGTGSVKYEVCGGRDNCTIADMHTHFYCEKCHRTFCLKHFRPSCRSSRRIQRQFSQLYHKGNLPGVPQDAGCPE